MSEIQQREHQGVVARKLRLLVIDDSEQWLVKCKRDFEKRGFEVEVWRSVGERFGGELAQRYYENNLGMKQFHNHAVLHGMLSKQLKDFDAVLTDLHMDIAHESGSHADPRGGGYDVLKLVRNMNHEKPVFMHSGGVLSGDEYYQKERADFIAAGGNDLFRKGDNAAIAAAIRARLGLEPPSKAIG